jgi:hypothetical protein
MSQVYSVQFSKLSLDRAKNKQKQLPSKFLRLLSPDPKLEQSSVTVKEKL